ncbi:MFS general substrate transporter [Rickenella mellea]|uniref:MFS general substrate transporter n=1 Tax=Rickenella mellea TaxID=50990 RepID=A0A4Y7PUP0_9AGAM|nr:MFS general substrate transporter [Rickenella mellea]
MPSSRGSEKGDSASIEKDGSLSVVKAALDFGGDSTLPPPPSLTLGEEKKLYRKIDLRLMPILSLMYLCSFLDRGNAKLAGLVTQLHLVGNQYNIALTMYFIPYCLAECPANLVLKKLRPSRWLPGITIVWGTVMTMMGLVKTYPQLVGVRVCLGVAEAGLFPGVVYYLTLWYPRHMLQYRVGLFFGAATLAGAFSGLLAFAIEFMGGTQGLEAWSWIFILEGIATVAVGTLAFMVLVDFPVTAKFLTPEERAYVIWKKKYDNSSVGEVEHFKMRYLWAAFKDWQVWLHILIYMSIIGPLYGISLFLPSIIQGFGHSTPISQLLTVPPYIFATIMLLVFGHFSDKYRIRSPFILIGLTMLLIGFSIQISDTTHGVKYFGTFFCVAGAYAAFPGVVAWLGNNLAGQYKRGVGMAVQIGIGNFSGAIASNIFRTKDAPRYILGHGLELMFVGIGFITVPLAIFLYTRINTQRDTAERNADTAIKYTPEELREMGDRAPDFRYTL